MSASARTRIKARLLPRFPAAINGGLMIDATREGSALTLAFTMSRLSEAPAPESAWRLPAYDPLGDAYRSVTVGAVAAGVSVSLAQVSDMSADARAFNAAADVGAMRTVLGAAPATHGHGLAQIVDMSADARTVNAAADVAAMRAALGAAAATHTHAAAQITDSQAFGRSMLATATSAAGTALIDTFTASTKGLAPPSGGGTAAYLRADGTWTVPGGSGDVVGPASATDNAAARFDATTGKLIQSSPLLIADTTGALSRTGGGGIAVQGTNTNDSAATGFVGEVVESQVLVGTGVNLTSSTPANITSFALTPGDWDVWATIAYNPSATPSRFIGSISTSSATHVVSPGSGGFIDYRFTSTAFETGGSGSFAVGQRRISVSSNTTIYLVMTAVFSSGSCTGFGYLAARRVR
jgi:hypothetical protein